MAISNANQQPALVVSSNSTTSYEKLLESQKELISKQICELQNIVSKQCKLTGVNPLSQEMAAGALSIKIGKRPRDLLNPKAIKYMQSIFSVKDEINKKEIRAISALFGLTATQVRDFFNVQRSRVRRFIRLSREKAIQSTEGVQEQDGSLGSNVHPLNHPVPLNSVGPSSIEAPSYSMQDEVLPDTDNSEKSFIANIFNLLRKEETFSGQVKLMEWILQIQNASVLYWFLTNGGVMILASWLSQAAIEEQTTVLHVILRVLCHLPLDRASPAHMSAVLQSVNKLRFYRGSDISNRAKSLLSRWSKMLERSQAMRRPNANISSVEAQNEMLLKQSIGEIMENESLESRLDNPAATSLLQENSENSRSQSVKLLTGPSDDSNMKLLRGVSSSHTRERRKVQLVEQPGQKPASRGPQVTRIFSTSQGRPISADDIQKAKMRAQFMRSKYGESSAPIPADENAKMRAKLVRSKYAESSAPIPADVLQKAKMRAEFVTSKFLDSSGSIRADVLQEAKKRAEFVTSKFLDSSGSIRADVLQEAKMRMSKHLESYTSPKMTTEVPRAAKADVHPKVEEHATSSSSVVSLGVKPHGQPKVEELKSAVKLGSGDDLQAVPVHGKEIIGFEEPVQNKCKRLQISWVIPPEMKINTEWSVCSGENSKEIDVQNNRIKREKEVFYNTTDLEIPPNPKEPWDREMDYDDSLTPEIPTEQLPDDDDNNMMVDPVNNDHTSTYAAAGENNNRNTIGPDLELLAVLLKNPQIVFALTAGQGGSLTNEQMVSLLDAIKANAARGGSIDSLVNGLVERKAEERVEVSLPSPTPSSSNPPVTNGWRHENPFSRQSVAVNNDIPGVYFQETVAPGIHQRLVPDHQRNPYFLPEHGGSQIQPPPRVAPAQLWMGREANNNNNNPYSGHVDHNSPTNYNVAAAAYGTREFENPGVGPSWVRYPGFESWSPDDSPTRYPDRSYRPEMMSRMQNRYEEQQRGGRNGWRDRRR